MVLALHYLRGVMKSLLTLASASAFVLATASDAHADPQVPCVDGVCVAPAPVVYETRHEARDKPVPTRMRSIPVFVTGVVFDVIGGAATAAGVGLLVASPDCNRYDASTANGYSVLRDYGCGVSSTIIDLAGIGALAGGAIFLAIGIPLTASGARSVPDVEKASAIPAVRVGATGGSLTWKF